jgi:hypothetical protein
MYEEESVRLVKIIFCLAATSLLSLMPASAVAFQSGLQSRAERSNYTETSRYADVMEFIANLKRASKSISVETFATTNEGRALPLVILSRRAISGPGEAARAGKPVVFIMANIHAGEVEGKEAAQHLMREMVTGPLRPLLEKMIVLVAPIYNADGNEKIDIKNRTAQNGPQGGVGTRENAQKLDLNRDFMKLDSPEARGLIEGVFNRWDPHVVIDLHTTNGSYHGYALTYSPPLNPNTDSRIISFTRDRLLPAVTKTLRDKHSYNAYYYGNFADERNPLRESAPDRSTDPKAWATFDYRPRFGNNYVGLRNRIAILSEAYSYLDFRTRVDVTDKFVRAILQYIAQRPAEVIEVVRAADNRAAATGRTLGNEKGYGIAFELKALPAPVEILVGSVNRVIDPRTNRPRFEATKEARPVKMIEYGEFQATRRISPGAAYILKPDQGKAIKLLQMHGIAVETTKKAESFNVQQYTLKGVTRSQRAFQGHRETKAEVSLSDARVEFPAGSFVIPLTQPKAALVFYLLEPESDDGLLNWNFFEEELAQFEKGSGSPVYPVYVLEELPKARGERLKR